MWKLGYEYTLDLYFQPLLYQRLYAMLCYLYLEKFVQFEKDLS